LAAVYELLVPGLQPSVASLSTMHLYQSQRRAAENQTRQALGEECS
jgi:hypothetical protein